MRIKGAFCSAEVLIDDIDSVLSFPNGKDNKRKECDSPAIGVAILLGSAFGEDARRRELQGVVVVRDTGMATLQSF